MTISSKAPQILLTSTTSAVNSNDFTVDRCPVAVRTYGAALTGSETITIQYKDNAGSYHAVVDVVSGSATLTATANVVVLDGGGTYRAAKTTTSGSVGIEKWDYALR